jgi:hypothetical protein
MKRLCWFTSILLLLSACARLPQIYSPIGARGPDPEVCERIFPKNGWQLLHHIEAAPPDGSRQTLLGVMQFTSRNDVHCTLLTLEGLVMLEARYDGVVHVDRAVPPMDRPGLAEGMVRDLLLVFFPPEGPVRQAGVSDGGDMICRYDLTDGGIQDIRLQHDGYWTIRRYHRNRLTRTIRSDPDAGFSSLGLPVRLVLQAHGLIGYQLTMNLLEAHPLEVQ